MAYHIARNGQTYGPYTLDDLERYVASGHVLLTDLARSDESPDYLPVAEVLRVAGRTPVAPVSPSVPYQPAPGNPAPAYVVPAPYAQQAALNNPPNLHWALVLLFDVLTCSFFQMVWNIIMGAWFRRVSPGSKTLWLYIASAILLVVQGITGQALGVLAGRNGGLFGTPGHPHLVFGGGVATYSLIALTCWVVRLVARFTFRAELEQHFNTVDPIGLRVNPFLTFFFGGLYLQSVLNSINETKRLQLYGVLPR